MASEYLKWKYRDVKPEQAQEATPAQRRKNWWYYHKWHIVIGLIVLLIAGGILRSALNKVEPDCQIAYVGRYPLPDDTAAALEAGFASLCGDLNGDGKAVVRLKQYAGGADIEAAYSAEVTLTSDLLEYESFLFLLEDPVQFQLNYHSLCRLDGSLPEAGDNATEELCLLWSQCPVLAQMALGTYSYTAEGQLVTGSSNELLAGLYIARRGFWEGKTVPNPEGCEALWKKLTEGAST